MRKDASAYDKGMRRRSRKSGDESLRPEQGQNSIQREKKINPEKKQKAEVKNESQTVG